MRRRGSALFQINPLRSR